MNDNFYDPEAVPGEWLALEYTPYRTPAPDLETALAAELALSSLTASERDVIELAMGFRGDPKTDEEVAIIRGSTKRTIKEQRKKALTKMRAALVAKD